MRARVFVDGIIVFLREYVFAYWRCHPWKASTFIKIALALILLPFAALKCAAAFPRKETARREKAERDRKMQILFRDFSRGEPAAVSLVFAALAKKKEDAALAKGK